MSARRTIRPAEASARRYGPGAGNGQPDGRRGKVVIHAVIGQRQIWTEDNDEPSQSKQADRVAAAGLEQHQGHQGQRQKGCQNPGRSERKAADGGQADRAERPSPVSPQGGQNPKVQVQGVDAPVRRRRGREMNQHESRRNREHRQDLFQQGPGEETAVERGQGGVDHVDFQRAEPQQEGGPVAEVMAARCRFRRRAEENRRPAGKRNC